MDGHVFVHKELFCHSYQFLPCSNSLDLSSSPCLRLCARAVCNKESKRLLPNYQLVHLEVCQLHLHEVFCKRHEICYLQNPPLLLSCDIKVNRCTITDKHRFF